MEFLAAVHPDDPGRGVESLAAIGGGFVAKFSLPSIIAWFGQMVGSDG